MEAIEFNTKMNTPNSIEIPPHYRNKVKKDQQIKVILLLDIAEDSDENSVWKELSTRYFFKEYSDKDSIYNEM